MRQTRPPVVFSVLCLMPMSEKPKPNLGGRPPVEITDNQLRQAEVLAGLGLTQKQIAYIIGVPERTWTRKKREKRVLAAAEKGKATAQFKLSNKLFEEAMKGNIAALIWIEKTRFGWSEKVRQEVSGAGGGPVILKVEYEE